MAEFVDMEPPFSLHSMDSANSDTESMELMSGGEGDEEREDKGVFVLRQKTNIIYSLDYKYRVGETDTCYPGYSPRFVNVPTVITLVGLPARGKTYMAKKLGRYLNWIGIRTKVFNVGEYRRRAVGSDKLHDFFRVDNKEAYKLRRQCALACLEDVNSWFLNRGGQVAIFDATNTTIERREMILSFCSPRGFKVFFMESICTDPDIVAANIRVMGHEFLTSEEFKLWEESPTSPLPVPPQEVKVFSPDYVTVDRDTAIEDFRQRIKHYEDAYEPLSLEKEGQLSFIKIINAGEQYIVNNIDGYLQSRAVYFLMNSHIKKRSIYLTRHGESVFTLQKRLGGDSELTVRGEEFSLALAKFIEDEKLTDLKVWTSQLKRAVDTAQHLKKKEIPIERWKALNEMDHGIYDGMTLDEIKKMNPEEHKVLEEHPFNYRYPRGESYSDVCARLESVIMELERQSNVLVICHEAILQCLMAYFLDHSSGELPNLSIPFHTVFKLIPIAYGCRVEQYPLFGTKPRSASPPKNQ